MKPLEEIMEYRGLDVRSLAPDGGSGVISINGVRCSVVFSWGGGWDHVSIVPFNKKTPSWEDMCKLKKIFFKDDEAVMQIHPKKEDYVNVVKNCLHLWRPIDKELPLPPRLYV